MEEILFLIGKEKSKRPFHLPKITFWLSIFSTLVIVFYFGWLNQSQGKYYQSLSENFRTLEFLVPAPRGQIFDRHGQVITKSVPAFDVYVNLRQAFFAEKEIFKKLQGDQRVFYRGEYALIRAVPLGKISQFIIEKDKYPNIEILPSYSRVYPAGEAAGSFVGYIGFSEKSKSDLFYGLTGLEKFYDQYLRGRSGKIIYQRKPNGDKGDLVQEVKAETGYDLTTTIDLSFQEKAYQLMKDYFQQKGYQKGALLALNPKTGEIIALISFPSYDPNWFLQNPKKAEEVLVHSLKPLFNRIVSGQYSPGSTIKPVVAIAALEEGIVTPEKKFYSGGYLKIPHPYIPGKFSIFHDWKVHGWADLRKAIADSVNVYFYIVGGGYQDQPGLGITKLLQWWQLFGLGKETKIDLPNEQTGFLPSPQNKYKLHPLDPIWRLGDTYNVSIGQGDLLVTPLQITLWMAALATNQLVKPHLLSKIVDYNGRVVLQAKPFFVWQNRLDQNKLQVVQEGMRQTVTKGTAKYLSDLPFKLAGKSGTPEIFGKQKLNAIFTGYAPYDNPEIVLTILIEEVPIGSVATLPLYKEVIKTYFELKNKSSK